MSISQISAKEFRIRLAALENPEQKFAEDDLQKIKIQSVQFILVLREVYGEVLDRKKVWERITNGLPVAAAKSMGKIDKFIADMLAYVHANANAVVGNDTLKALVDELKYESKEYQRLFIRYCVEYRMLIALAAREDVENLKSLQAQTGSNDVEVLSTGEIVARRAK
jgi:CO dehydrogenase/acetyl-CoA synthase gamma subunit (corrinoid Fe-S protein)